MGTFRPSATFTRRQLVAAAGTGIAAFPLVAGAGAVQFDATPPAPLVATPEPPSGETIGDVAARLEYDLDAIVAFVRDEIHFESYAGVLRGATGTLWARAGNAADQAVLLGELLTAAQLPWRFAIGPLGPEREAALTDRLSLSLDEAAAALLQATIAASLHAAGVDDVADLAQAASDGQAYLDQFNDSSRAAIDLAQTSLDTSAAAIVDALDAAGIALPPLGAPTLTAFELDHHAWIQVADGPDWTDYDPTIPADAAPATPDETPNALPDDWRHQVTIAIASDDYLSGTLSRRELVSYASTGDQLANFPVAISLAAPDDLSTLGVTLTELFTGQKSIFPSIYANGVTIDATDALAFSIGDVTATDPLSDPSAGGVADGETVAVWLVTTIASPGAAPVTIERALLDRVPPADRASGLITPETIAPVTLVRNALGEETLEQFTVLPIIHTDVARMPAVDAVVRFTKDTVFGGLGLLGPALAGYRDSLGLQEEASRGCWSYPSAPNLTVFHVSLPPDDDHDSPATISVDLLHRERASLPLADVEASSPVQPLLLAGILNAVAEQALLAPETRGEAANPAAYATLPSVGDIFTAAADSGQAMRVLTSSGDLAGIDADSASQAHLTAALDMGLYVVVPDGPVDVDGVPFLGWWIIDPATGSARDQLQNGMAFASTTIPARFLPAMQDLGEYSFLTRAVLWVVANSARLACIAFGITAGMFAANAYIAAGSASASGTEVGASVGGVLGAGAAASGVC